MHGPSVPSPFDARNLHHTGVVVRDIDQAIAALQTLGIGPFAMPDGRPWADIAFSGQLHGRPAAWRVKISTASVGAHEIELLQPNGGPSILQEFLDQHGEGVHHIAYLVGDVQSELESLARQGIEILTSATWPPAALPTSAPPPAAWSSNSALVSPCRGRARK
jgi:catechol 2,3-dioxygenase-like lactoylglutathione lyase family enzyme